MNLGKVKTFLIFLFLGINIYLLISMFMSTRFFIDKNTVRATVSVLEKNGITLDEKKIAPFFVNLKNIDTNNIAYTGKFKNATKNEDIELKDDYFTLTRTVKDVHLLSDNQLINTAKDIMTSLGADSKCMTAGKVRADDNNVRRVTIRCKVGKYEVFDSKVTVVAQKDSLTIGGRWYQPLSMKYKTKSRSRNTVYITSVLVSMLQNKEIMKNAPFEIKDIRYGYLAGTSYGEGVHITTSALPYYKITDSQNNVYYYDARNGTYLK